MQIISQSIDHLQSLNKNISNLISFLEVINLTHASSELISSYFSAHLEINDLLDDLNSTASSLNELLKPITSQVKRNEVVSSIKIKQDNGEPYASFIVDEAPIIGTSNDAKPTSDDKKVNYEELLNQHLLSTGKQLKPIKDRPDFSFSGVCPFCGAPHNYIYDNNKHGQFLCKICKHTFSVHSNYAHEITIRCPHCNFSLMTKHIRKNYTVLCCNNDKCSFYLDNFEKYKNNNAEELRTSSNLYKLHYYYRAFDIDFDSLNKDKGIHIDSKVNLARIHHSQYTLGLILTYYVNYGLSSRKVSSIMWDIHKIKISHQSIRNYAEASAGVVQHLVDKYPYDLSTNIVGDETYIKVNGKTQYVFFFSDAYKKIITSYRIYPNRDTLCAIQSIYQTIRKFNTIPDNLDITVDGNPIYNAAQVFFKINNIHFNLHQVIGVSNKDAVSTQYRPQKQVTERLNRTYKENYYGTNGYGTSHCANVYMILYVTFFNFLRRHTYLNYKSPVVIEEMDDLDMPNKWLHLLSISYEYINS